MTLEQEAALNAPAANIIAVPISSKGDLASIVIKTADGRIFNLGKPDSILFPIRRWFYLWKRRKELKQTKG